MNTACPGLDHEDCPSPADELCRRLGMVAEPDGCVRGTVTLYPETPGRLLDLKM